MPGSDQWIAIILCLEESRFEFIDGLSEQMSKLRRRALLAELSLLVADLNNEAHWQLVEYHRSAQHDDWSSGCRSLLNLDWLLRRQRSYYWESSLTVQSVGFNVLLAAAQLSLPPFGTMHNSFNACQNTDAALLGQCSFLLVNLAENKEYIQAMSFLAQAFIELEDTGRSRTVSLQGSLTDVDSPSTFQSAAWESIRALIMRVVALQKQELKNLLGAEFDVVSIDPNCDEVGVYGRIRSEDGHTKEHCDLGYMATVADNALVNADHFYTIRTLVGNEPSPDFRASQLQFRTIQDTFAVPDARGPVFVVFGSRRLHHTLPHNTEGLRIARRCSMDWRATITSTVAHD